VQGKKKYKFDAKDIKLNGASRALVNHINKENLSFFLSK
jgi:hypothetical protein